VLAIASIGVVMRLVRSSLIEELDKDYVRTARAYGLPRRKVVLSYALPNALTPFVTVMGLELSALLFGSVVIESVFGWPGREAAARRTA
jgi:ABC-type dipeptide/oligopeptide/nickel transport system permease component